METVFGEGARVSLNGEPGVQCMHAQEVHSTCLLAAIAPPSNAGILNTLSNAGAEADQLAQMVESTLLGPFREAVHVSDAGAWFDAAPWLDQPPLFWREALRRLCHAMGTGMVKDKAVAELLTRLRRGAKARDGWIPLKRDNKSFIHGTRVVRGLRHLGYKAE